MVSAESARFVVGVIGNAISFVLFLSPAPTIKTIWKRKAVEDFKPDPYLATIINCVLWIVYGLPVVHPNSTLVITINGVGLALELCYTAIFFYFGTKKHRKKIIGVLLLEAVFVAALAVITMLFFHKYKSRSNFIGDFCVFFGIIMYASPLTIMWKVMKTKSVEYMPLTLSLASFLNGCVWLSYALIIFDLYILIGNGIGAIFGAAQLILYFTYYKSTTPKHNEAKKPSEVQLSGSRTAEP